jgi:hypothetical protein
VAVVIIATALIIAAGIAASGGLYQIVSAGPESTYLVHRWTGETWYLTGDVLHPVKAAPPQMERNFGK